MTSAWQKYFKENNNLEEEAKDNQKDLEELKSEMEKQNKELEKIIEPLKKSKRNERFSLDKKRHSFLLGNKK